MKAWPLQFYWKLGPIFTPLKSELKSILPILTLELKSVKWGMFQNSGSLKTVGFLLKSTISIGFGGSLILKHNEIDANKCMYKLFGLNEILHGKPACLPDSVAALALSLSNSGSSTSAWGHHLDANHASISPCFLVLHVDSVTSNHNNDVNAAFSTFNLNSTGSNAAMLLILLNWTKRLWVLLLQCMTASVTSTASTKTHAC